MKKENSLYFNDDNYYNFDNKERRIQRYIDCCLTVIDSINIHYFWGLTFNIESHSLYKNEGNILIYKGSDYEQDYKFLNELYYLLEFYLSKYLSYSNKTLLGSISGFSVSDYELFFSKDSLESYKSKIENECYKLIDEINNYSGWKLKYIRKNNSIIFNLTEGNVIQSDDKDDRVYILTLFSGENEFCVYEYLISLKKDILFLLIQIEELFNDTTININTDMFIDPKSFEKIDLTNEQNKEKIKDLSRLAKINNKSFDYNNDCVVKVRFVSSKAKSLDMCKDGFKYYDENGVEWEGKLSIDVLPKSFLKDHKEDDHITIKCPVSLIHGNIKKDVLLIMDVHLSQLKYRYAKQGRLEDVIKDK